MIGLDLDCGDYYTNFTATAVAQGKVREKDIDTSLNFLYVVLMRLGYFDGLPDYDNLGADDICSDENIELATEAARQGIVLLKNVDETMPLSDKIRRIAVVGPHANATAALIGNYAGVCFIKLNSCYTYMHLEHVVDRYNIVLFNLNGSDELV